MTTGIHHITLITRKVQANVDYYVGFLGLRLVKQTAGYEDAMQLHLFYGDGAATPGTLLTFLVWEDGSPGRVGHGQTSEISLAIDPSSIGYWLTRSLSFGFRPEGPVNEFGEPTLRLKDPDGVIVKLVGVTGIETGHPWNTENIPAEHAIRRIRGATILTEVPEMTQAFLRDNFEYQQAETEGNIWRMKSESSDIIDIRDAKGFWSSAPAPRLPPSPPDRLGRTGLCSRAQPGSARLLHCRRVRDRDPGRDRPGKSCRVVNRSLTVRR